MHGVFIHVRRHDERVVDVGDEAFSTLVFPLVEPETILVDSELATCDRQLERCVVNSLHVGEGDFQHLAGLRHRHIGAPWLLDVADRHVDRLTRVSTVGDRKPSKFVAEGVNSIVLTLLREPVGRLLYRVSLKVQSYNLVPADVQLQVLHSDLVVLCGHQNLVLGELVQAVITDQRLVADHPCDDLQRVVAGVDPLGVQASKFVAGDCRVPVADDGVEQLTLVSVCILGDGVNVVALQASVDFVQPIC